MASIRKNLSLYERAPNYVKQEKRSIRLTITTRNAEDEAIETRLTSILDMFSVGSHVSYKTHIGGIRQIGFNLYQLMVNDEMAKKLLIEKFSKASTARGSNQEDVFEFMIDDFKGEIKNITMYPIPMEMDTEELKYIIEDILKLGAVESINWGKHKFHKQWRNGFAHVKIRGLTEDMPDRFLINNRPVTLLQQNQRLYRPCRLCKMRTHEKQNCPSFLAFEELAEAKVHEALERERMKENDEESPINKENHTQEKNEQGKNLETQISDLLSNERQTSSHQGLLNRSLGAATGENELNDGHNTTMQMHRGSDSAFQVQPSSHTAVIPLQTSLSTSNLTNTRKKELKQQAEESIRQQKTENSKKPNDKKKSSGTKRGRDQGSSPEGGEPKNTRNFLATLRKGRGGKT